MLTRVLIVNVNWGTRPARADHLIDKLVRTYRPDVILAVETKRVRLSKVLGHDWRTLQGHGGGRQNSGVAWRRNLGTARRRRWILGTMPNGARMLPRWMPRVLLKLDDRVAFQAVHLPPSRYARLYAGYLHNMSQHRRIRHLVLGGDANQADLSAVTAGMHVKRAGVMFLATTLPIRDYVAHKVAGFDHDVIVADLET